MCSIDFYVCVFVEFNYVLSFFPTMINNAKSNFFKSGNSVASKNSSLKSFLHEKILFKAEISALNIHSHTLGIIIMFIRVELQND